jgi:L-ascorbate metabolism protein UlaG (beta-lactamase superfamily)
MPTIQKITSGLASLLLLVAGVLCSVLTIGTQAENHSSTPETVRVEFIAHACFRITSPAGKRVLIDPYASRIWLGYVADAVLISHPHYDHDIGERGGRKLPWNAPVVVLRGPCTNQIGDVTVVGFKGKHAEPYGHEFGQSNTVWQLTIAGLHIVHLGDNGPLTDELVKQLGRVDVLMIPIDDQSHLLKPHEIELIRNQLAPKILIPMHYRHSDLELDPKKPELLGGIDEWAKKQSSVHFASSNELRLSRGDLPNTPEIVILKHSPLVTRPSGVAPLH